MSLMHMALVTVCKSCQMNTHLGLHTQVLDILTNTLGTAYINTYTYLHTDTDMDVQPLHSQTRYVHQYIIPMVHIT